MSGYPGGSNEGNVLDSLFGQLRQQSNQPVNLEPSYSYYNNNNSFFGQPGQAQQPLHAYQQPSASSPVPTPPTGGNPPHHGSAVISPAETPQPRLTPTTSGASNADRTSSLLNLLKFSQPSANSPHQPAIGSQLPLPPSREPSTSFAGSDVLGQVSASSHGRGGSDLLAALMGNVQSKPAQQVEPQFTTATQPQPSFGAAPSSPPANTQAYLLQLLNQPSKPPQSENTPPLKPVKILTPPSKASSQDQDDIGELAQALEDASLNLNMMGSAATEAIPSFGKENVRESQKSTQGLFTYVNPFEQLAASSPRNRTPKAATPAPASASATTPAIQILKHPRHENPDNKRKVEAGSSVSSISSPAHTKRKLEPASQESSAPPTPLPDGRTKLEALIGIGASGKKETVHDALCEVADQVEKEVQEAIANAEHDENHASIEQDLKNMLAAKTEKEFEETAQIAAIAIKAELEKEDMIGALDDLPTPLAEAVKDIIDDTAQGHIADSWESADAEDSPVKEEEESVVKVYNFPMKPWTIITILEHKEGRPFFRDEAIMDIARLKKEFDQIDRTLVTASNNFIVYGMSKNGGVRIIRQDDGKDARLFTETHDRIFSVATSASPADRKESIIATGISGTVYWSLVKNGEGDHIEDDNIESYGFALPPVQTTDNESPGGVLKTRARKSSAHPDFFAVGRGKYIHIVWPSLITKQSYLKDGQDRVVDVDKYLSNHSLKVNTGKAGKDFTFSEDDSTIVSLDKAGRVKFWDVRELTKTDILGSPAHPNHIEIKEPLITFTTTHPHEKSWPTSVLFVDKLRPYQRGGALRYLIVGMKQNHTLQLWDLGLGKPVQEIHLPHNKESDAVCSVLYHAATGMIVVGHPTRNSIYFFHLSAPKYNLPKNITQAEYMEKLVAIDPSIPKPDATAVISGMREYSFSNKGQLRSLDILQTPNSAVAGTEPVTLFELYAMHSKGVTCLNIKQADLGWATDNKVIHPVVAEKAGVISIDRLKEIAAPAADPVDVQPVAQSTPPRTAARPAAKESIAKETPKKASHAEPSASASKPDVKDSSNGGIASASGPERSEKKKKRKATAENAASGPSQTTLPPKPIILDPSSHSRNGNISRGADKSTSEPSGPPLDFSDASLKNLETRVSGEVKKLLGESIDSLYRNIKDDRRTQDAVSEAKQDAMLRLVSSTLTDNVEVALGRIVSSNIQKSVLPVISDVAVKAVNEQLGSKLSTSIAQNMPKELQRALPDAIGKALQQPQLLKLMSESLAKSVAFRVEEQFAVLLQNVVTPAFTKLATQSSQRIAGDIQRQAAEQIANIERERREDSIKIDQLQQLVTGLTATVSSMAAAQGEFQGQFLRLQQQAANDRRQAATRQSEARTNSPEASTAVTRQVHRSPAEEEYQVMLKLINDTFNAGEVENAVIQWLQTQREQEFFRRYFSKWNPDFVRELSPLLLLSLGATISYEFEDDYIEPRMAWMEKILAAFQVHVNAGTCVSTPGSVSGHPS